MKNASNKTQNSRRVSRRHRRELGKSERVRKLFGSRRGSFEVLESRIVLAADLGLLPPNIAGDSNGGFFTNLQAELDTDVLNAPLPLVGSQLANASGGDFLAQIDTSLSGFALDSDPTIDEVKTELRTKLGSLLVTPSGGTDISVAGQETDDEIQFQFTLADTVQLTGLSLDLALGTDPVIGAFIGDDGLVDVTMDWEMQVTFSVTDTAFQYETVAQDELSIVVTAVADDTWTDVKGRVGVLTAELDAMSGETQSFSGTYLIDVQDGDGNE